MQIRIKDSRYKLNNQPFLVTDETPNSYFIWINTLGTLCIPKENCEIVQEEPIKPILKPFTFEEWNKDRSQPVWTTKYGKVEELTYFVNCKDSYPLVGLVNKSKVAYSLEGRSNGWADDLMLESKEKEYYANVYRNADGSVEVGHASDKAYSKEQAEKHRDIFIMTISFKC
jgi:hypothetical protein